MRYDTEFSVSIVNVRGVSYKGHISSEVSSISKTDDNVGKLKQIRSSDNEERLHNSFVC